jgi:hypothetical protein
VCEVDDRLGESLRVLRDGGANDGLTWTRDHWDGTTYALPGHAPGEVEQFYQECVRFRLITIKPTLKLMRGSFRYNVGFEKKPLLARMAQAVGVISSEALKGITI